MMCRSNSIVVWTFVATLSAGVGTATPSMVFFQEAGTPRQGGGVAVGVGSGLVGGPGVRPAPGAASAERQSGSVNVQQAPAPAAGSAGGGSDPSSGTGLVAPGAGNRASGGTGDLSKGAGRGIKLNFANAEIARVVNAIMQELGYSYVISPAVQGTVNIYSSREIPRERLFDVLEQLLKMNGVAIVRQPDYYVIVPIGEGPTVPHEVLMQRAGPEAASGGTQPTEKPESQVAKPGQEGEGSEPAPESEENQEPGEEPPSRPEEAEPAGSSPEEPVEAGPRVMRLEPTGRLEQQGMITYIVPLNYILSENMLEMAKVFLSPGATVVDFAPANMLIISDYPDNIQQVLNLVDLLDTRYFDLNRVDLIPIRFHNAADVAVDLGKIFAPGDQAAGVRLVAIERLNSILVVTRAPEVLAEVKKWIERLDAPASSSNIKTYVYQVENNTAVQIAQILAELYQDGMGLPSSALPSSSQPGVGVSGETAGAQTSRQFVQRGSQYGQVGAYGGYGGYGGDYGGYGNYGSYGSYGSYGGYGGYGREPLARGAYGSSLGMRQLGPALSAASQSQIRSIYAGNVKLVVNEFNNTLIVQGTEADIQFILDTVKQLDTLPRQVVVEARIYSVELRDDLNYGVSAFLQAQGVGATGEGGAFVPATTGSVSSGGELTVSTRAMVGSEREIQAILKALRDKTNVEVLEAPRVLALDGTPASINIGAEVPVTSASWGDPIQSGTTTFINSIQFRPTGTTLLFVPRISAGGVITMDVVLEVSSATGPTLTPTIQRNYIQSSFIVRDGQSIGIAGLISDTFDVSRKRVPLLGDIPILGGLFGTTSKRERRFELIIFITPQVIRDLPTSAELTLDFKRALRNAYQFIQRVEEEERRLKQERQEDEGAGRPAAP